jgi:antitoxin ParD1/3/4
MNKIEKRTFSLPVEHADFIDEKVNSGSYASASEVVRAGLRALQERDAAMERWLNKEVAEAYHAMKADPKRGIPVEQVFAVLSKRRVRKLRDIKDDKRLVEIIKSRADEVGISVNINEL